MRDLRKLVPLGMLLACGSAVRVGDRPGHRDVSKSLSTRRGIVSTETRPLSLVAGDGTTLDLSEVGARVVVEGPLAYTELSLTFENPTGRQLEGRFSIHLPGKASISRLAMYSGGSWQEGEVVARPLARASFETFLHRKRDPALLEHEAGDRFQARIFPIEPHQQKKLIIGYSEELPSSRAGYRLRLAGLGKLARLSVVAFQGGQTTKVSKRDTVAADFSLPPQGSADGLRSANLAVARVRARVAEEADPVRALTVLVDTSASMAGSLEESARLVTELAASLPPDVTVTVAAFDQEVMPLYAGSAARLGGAELARIPARGAQGASDVAGALAWARARAAGRILLVTDGVITAGGVPRAGGERIDVALVGASRDPAAMAPLARRGIVLGATTGEALRAELERRVAPTTIAVRDAAWSWPTEVTGLRDGDEVLVYADLPLGRRAADQPLEVTVNGRLQQVALRPAARPLVDRAVAGARIAALTARGATRQQIVDLSTRYRVLSDHTSLLVLESELDYATFGIDRTALADILTVGKAGLEVVQRQGPAKGAAAPVAAAAARPGPGTISGRVVDAGSGGPLLLVTVVATSPSLQGQQSEFTDTEGRYLLGNLPAGRYSVLFIYGDAKVKREAVEVSSARPTVVNARISTAATGEVITIRERAPTIDAGSTRQGMTIGQDMLRSAPAGGRSSGDSFGSSFSGSTSVESSTTASGDEQAAPGLEIGDLLEAIELGDALRARGDLRGAARAYGSILDLYPGRAELVRHAAVLLDAAGAQALARDALARAAADRPDQPGGRRLLAYALARAGRPAEAFAELQAALKAQLPDGRFAGVQAVLREDLGIIAACWLRKEPGRREEVLRRLKAAGAALATGPSLRFVLSWATDASDVDLSVTDALGERASYQHPRLGSGGVLVADNTTGLGPEAFIIRGKPGGYPYGLRADFYRQGSTGVGVGAVQIVAYDGAGKLRVEERPFALAETADHADLGLVDYR